MQDFGTAFGPTTVLKKQHLDTRWAWRIVSPESAKHATAENLPLHTKQVPPVSCEERVAILGTFGCRQLAGFKEAVGLFSKLDKGTETRTADLSPADIEVLRRERLIEPTDERANTRSFTVPELAKARRRWICHPKVFNDHCRLHMEKIQLPLPTSVMSKVRHRFGRQLDFKAYYHQFSTTSAKFIINTTLGNYRLTTIPTGASNCPLLAQLYSLALVEKAFDEYSRRFPDSVIVCEVDVYIDNVRVTGNDLTQVDKIVSIIFELAEAFKIVINESLQEVLSSDPTKYEFLGIRFDHGNQTTALGSKTRSKLQELLQTSFWRLDPTIETCLHAFGLLQYASMVNSSPKADYYYIFKFLRRRVGERLAARAQIWPSTFELWHQWLYSELHYKDRSWRVTLPKTNQITLFTDASSSGYGCVAIHSDGMWIHAGRWSHWWASQHINVLEASALLRGLDWLADKSSGDISISVRIDNTSVLYCTQKTWSRSWLLNEIIGQIQLHRMWPCVTGVTYVKSEDNLADGPSRGKRRFELEKLEHRL